LFTLPVIAEPKPASGEITNVIVYHGRALVTRTIELDKTTGDIELLVEHLPDRILPESIYAQADDGIQVLSVRYRVKEIKEDPRQEIRELDRQLEELATELYRLDRDRQLCTAQCNRFEKMWQLSLEGANVSLDRAAFDAENLREYTTYLEEKGQSWHDKAVEIELRQQEVKKQQANLQKEKDRLSKGHRRTLRQALVYLNKLSGKASTLEVSYLVTGADWTPQYNLKANSAGKEVNIEYNAVVHQSSGEHWNNAQLSLSTAVPALVATPPTLDPIKISLAAGGYGRPGERIRRATDGDMDMMMESVAAKAPQQQPFSYMDQTEKFGVLIQNRRDNISKGIKANSELNQIAISNQMIEFEADKRMLQEIKRKAIAIKRTEGISVMYKLPGKLTLPSKSDQQLVTIASMKCPGSFTYVAAPLLTDYVYLQADITNDSDTILLPGAADMFRNGQFVGKGDMKLVTIGQSFTTGFGVDSRIQVTREFKDKKTENLWGNRVDEHKYRIEISNYSNKQASLRLMDRLPWTENEELSIELTKMSHELSKDAEYVRTQKKQGILRWDLVLKPNTTGPKATILNYDFTMKYDNDMSVRNIN
ncbi:MAG: mucoidy inhibitor MuiA family protein, partial [Planctomycetota bacterium]